MPPSLKNLSEEQLQKVLIESPVPVLIDVYAGYCEPCKQLTPLLEQAVIRAGGALRLATIDSEAQRNLCGDTALKIRALPTVFGMKDGRLLDSFRGILPVEELQQFFVKVLGLG